MKVLMVVRNMEAKRDVERHMPESVHVAAPGVNLLGHRFDMVMVMAPMTTPQEREWFNRMFPACLSVNADLHSLWDEG